MLDKKELEGFVNRLRGIEAEIKLLQEDRKGLFEELKERVKPEVLREAVRIVKKRAKFGDDVAALDQIVELLDGEIT
jgi:uncharacterized protein (UPF0335 family)